jgi:hypothetical protein
VKAVETDMGDLVLHPTHWLFRQFKHPACPECQTEILPLTPVDIEELPNGSKMFRHAECAGVPANDTQPV